VTRTAALAREVDPSANANRVEQAIEQGADLLNGNNDPHLGAGRLNAGGCRRHGGPLTRSAQTAA